MTKPSATSTVREMKEQIRTSPTALCPPEITFNAGDIECRAVANDEESSSSDATGETCETELYTTSFGGTSSEMASLTGEYRCEFDPLRPIPTEAAEGGMEKGPRHPEYQCASSPLRVLVLMCCVLAWYLTNGTNFIALQRFSKSIALSFESERRRQDLGSNAVIMGVITSAQLGIGTLLGCAWLVCMRVRTPPLVVWLTTPSAAGVLHGVCSFSMNVACMYGTATLVQAIKLLEPFDTLLLGLLIVQLLSPPAGVGVGDENERSAVARRPKGPLVTVGILSSIAVIVAAAISLIGSSSNRETPPHGLAVAFALVSSVALCTRNVLQKHVHEEKEEDGQGQGEGEGRGGRELTKLQRSVLNFTKFSFQGFLLASAIVCVLLIGNGFAVPLTPAQWTEGMSWKLFICHPLYNLFSIITLGFVSALTHSLLNVGKRIFGIVLAIAIFRDTAMTSAVLKGLLLAGFGGIWYTLENKAGARSQDKSGRKFEYAVKPLAALFVLTLLPQRGSHFALTTALGLRGPLIANTVAYEETTRRASVAVSSLPYRPDVESSDCRVAFVDDNMTLCHFIPYDGNFGDELGPVAARRLLEYNFGCSAVDIPVINLAREDRDGLQCLFDLGSIFHMLAEGDHVWGTGINPYWQKHYQNNITLYSVRGPKTAGLLRRWYRDEKGRRLTTLGYGDPGFLIPYLYQEYNRTDATSAAVASRTSSPAEESMKGDDEPVHTPRICFVPHFHDLENEAVQKAFPPENILSVQQHWRSMVSSLSTCDYVASSSLHGLILSDAMGIPNRWFQFGSDVSETKKTEGHFKYLDYYLSMNRTVPDPLDDLDEVMVLENYPPPIPRTDRDAFADSVVDSFPFHLFRTHDFREEGKYR